MDEEMNLASKFGGPRGKLKRLRKGKTGVGMEKPTDIEIPEEDEEMPEELSGREMPPLDLGAFGGPAPEDEELENDEAFRDLVDRMEGGSASMGRANARRAKLKGRRPVPSKNEDEE